MKFAIRYEDGLRVEVLEGALDTFLSSSLWKMRMPAARRRAAGYTGDEILFSSDLSADDRASVVEAFKAAERFGCSVVLEESYIDNEQSERSIIDEKAAVGLAIKAHDDSVEPLFKDYACVVNSCMVRPLRKQQMWDSFFLCSMKKAANFSVPGSGKTASTLGVYAYLKERGLAKRIIVICPKNAFGSWRDEWASTFGSLDPCRSLCFHDEVWAGKQKLVKSKELMLNAARYNLFLMNYESCGSYADELASLADAETLLVFDEVHKVKRVGGARAQSALAIAKHASYIVALTGTPIPNSYCDLYNLLNMLFARDYGRFFGYGPDALVDPGPVAVQRINEKLQPFFCRTNKRQLGVPDASPDSIYHVHASAVEDVIFERVKQVYRRDPLALIIRILQLESDVRMLCEAFNPSEIDGMLDDSLPGDQMGLPVLDVPGHLVSEATPTSKTTACVNLVSDLVAEGRTVVVWCFFKRSMQNLESALRKRGVKAAQINGSVPQGQRDEVLAAFKGGRLDVLVTNPHTLAESVSLHSVCHDAVYFEYSYNLVHLLQSKDRIHRLGLPVGQYTQYHYLQTFFETDCSDWSLDQRIYERLMEKEHVMLDAIDRGILEPGFADEEDLAVVFRGLFDMDDVGETVQSEVGEELASDASNDDA